MHLGVDLGANCQQSDIHNTKQVESEEKHVSSFYPTALFKPIDAPKSEKRSNSPQTSLLCMVSGGAEVPYPLKKRKLGWKLR